MQKNSAGILLYRFTNSKIQFLLTHPGGPYYIKKDLGSWTIPKGEFDQMEGSLNAAKREFFEETGYTLDDSNFIQLEPTRIKSGKIIHAWALERDIDQLNIKSNNFVIEWPPKSGKHQEFPEIDKADWFSFDDAKVKIHEGQVTFIDQLINILGIKNVRIYGKQQSLF